MVWNSFHNHCRVQKKGNDMRKDIAIAVSLTLAALLLGLAIGTAGAYLHSPGVASTCGGQTAGVDEVPTEKLDCTPWNI